MGGEGRRCRLYLLTPPEIQVEAFARLLTRTLDAGDVAALQLRLKPAGPEILLPAIEALRPIAQERGVALILNDRPDLAARTGCDGAHIGPEDMPYAEARRHLGPDAILGVSCKASRHAAMEAGEQGASYVAFGAFYDSVTKGVDAGADPALLAWWSEIMTVPSVAIGGITPENCGPLVQAGADFIAAAAGVWRHPAGPEAAVRAYDAAIDRALDLRD